MSDKLIDIKAIIKVMEERGVYITPLLPNANWIQIRGEFTPFELRALADYVEESYGNKN
jgi:hypothetical protein